MNVFELIQTIDKNCCQKPSYDVGDIGYSKNRWHFFFILYLYYTLNMPLSVKIIKVIKNRWTFTKHFDIPVETKYSNKSIRQCLKAE